jgi:CBS domain-containing protein
MLVKDFMTPNPVTVTPGKMADETLELMRNLNFRQCPVVEDGKLVGIVTDRDIKASKGSGVKVGISWPGTRYDTDYASLEGAAEIMGRQVQRLPWSRTRRWSAY